MRLGAKPPNTTVVNLAENVFVLLHVPSGVELVLPEGWTATEEAPLDLVRKKKCSQLNVRQAREVLPDAATFVV